MFGNMFLGPEYHPPTVNCPLAETLAYRPSAVGYALMVATVSDLYPCIVSSASGGLIISATKKNITRFVLAV